MSATVYRENVEAEIAEVRARTADFEELFCELVEEAGRALEADDLEWCALLQGVLIPQVEAKGPGLRVTH